VLVFLTYACTNTYIHVYTYIRNGQNLTVCVSRCLLYVYISKTRHARAPHDQHQSANKKHVKDNQTLERIHKIHTWVHSDMHTHSARYTREYVHAYIHTHVHTHIQRALEAEQRAAERQVFEARKAEAEIHVMNLAVRLRCIRAC
jgi:hypothetical protein